MALKGAQTVGEEGEATLQRALEVGPLVRWLAEAREDVRVWKILEVARACPAWGTALVRPEALLAVEDV